MLLLDTNVLSAMMSGAPDGPVAAWMERQPASALFTTAISQAETMSGIAIVAAGRRRAGLDAAARAMFTMDFEGRVLPFDAAAADAYAEIFAARRLMGRPSATLDLMVAAIARCWNAGVVTRNVDDFAGCGVEVINPWNV